MTRPMIELGVILILSASALVVACSSKTANGPATPPQSTAAAVAGPTDAHCANLPVVVAREAACHPDEAPDGGESDAGEPPDEEREAETRFNSEAEDDDCKYHVKWASSTVAKDGDVTLSVVVTNRNDSSPVAGAKPYTEIFLNDTHPAPNTPVATTETSAGSYAIGPVRFDAAGQWNVRFHFRSDCADSPDSPHGHVTFFVNVP